MKSFTRLSLIFLFTLIPMATIAQTNQGPAKFRSRRVILRENLEYRRQIDSLEKAIHEYREQIRIEDSLKNAILFEENENKVAAGSFGAIEYTPDVQDSLLSIWYHQTQIDRSREGDSYDMDSIHLTSDVPDKVFIDRIAKMNSFITLPFNETVKNYIILYAEKMPTKMGHILALCDYYMPIFEETFNKYGLPDELKYMAIIESALNPRAVSRAGAKGMWQFMFRTAKSYGLEIDSYVDERLDPYKSADAAARYLRDSYNVFGDWCLAISSYNCGAGNVSKAIRRAGGTKDFWRIYDFLPRETRGYMPAFVGAMYAVTYYKEHGLKPEKMQLPTHIDTLDIHKMLHFKQISGLLGIPEDYLRNLNPQYLHDIIPGSEKHSYTLRLPYNFTSNFVQQEDSVYTFMADSLFNPVMVSTVKEQAKTSSTITYIVKKGDYLGRIASRYHVSVAQLKRWNNLRSDNIRVGQRLFIHR